MNQPAETNKAKNSRLSLLLIIAIMILVVAYTCIGYHTEDESIVNLLACAIALTLLLAGYAFSYPGKAYRLGKWLFALVLLITLAMTGLLWYATQLGHAFQH